MHNRKDWRGMMWSVVAVIIAGAYWLADVFFSDIKLYRRWRGGRWERVDDPEFEKTWGKPSWRWQRSELRLEQVQGDREWVIPAFAILLCAVLLVSFVAYQRDGGHSARPKTYVFVP